MEQVIQFLFIASLFLSLLLSLCFIATWLYWTWLDKKAAKKYNRRGYVETNRLADLRKAYAARRMNQDEIAVNNLIVEIDKVKK